MSANTFNTYNLRNCSKEKKGFITISIRNLLIVLFVVQILIAAGLIYYILTANTQKAVNNLANQLRLEYNENIRRQVHNFLKSQSNINSINYNAISRGWVDSENQEFLAKYFLSQVKIFESINSIYFGNIDGGIANAGRDMDNSLYIIKTEGFSKGDFIKYTLDENDNLKGIIALVPDFDARRRPWYINALNSENTVWSPVYILYTGHDQVISASRSVYDSEGNFLGIVSTDLFLSKLGDFLSTIKLSKNSQSYIIDRSGLLVATSMNIRLFFFDEKEQTHYRVQATECESILIRSSAGYFLENHSLFEGISADKQLVFEIGSERHFLNITPFSLQEGLNWVILTVMPETDILEDVFAYRTRSVVIMVIFITAALIMGIMVANMISKPIRKLNALVKDYTIGGGRPIISGNFIAEANELSIAFDNMHVKLDNTINNLSREIGERERADHRLVQEKELLKTTLESIGDGVISTDINGRVTMINNIAEDLTGFNQQEAVGQPLEVVMDLYDQDTLKAFPNPFRTVLENGRITDTGNYTLLKARDEREYQISLSGAPIKDANNRVIGSVLVFRDVSERERFIENMYRTDKLESIGLLAGSIAHDFNNLLGGIFGYIQLAKGKTDKDSKIRHFLDKAIIAFERTRDLTQQLTAFSKGGDLDKKPGNVGKVLKECLTFALSGSGIMSRVTIADDLWTCDYDQNQIAQVFDNIIINAKQVLSSEGEITIIAENKAVGHSEFGDIPAGEYVKISISDNGPGIPKDIQKKIFDPYFTTKQQGNGLGLATCYSIVKKHQGYIQVDSDIIRKGTTFYIYLPVSKGDIEIKTDNKTYFKGSGKIIIMDDEDYNIELMSEMLGDLGFEVIPTSKGEELLDLVAEYHIKKIKISAIILDLTIQGGKGGKDIILDLRSLFPYTPIFASSGYSSDPAISRPQEFGFTASIKKPFLLEELSEIFSLYIKE